MVFIEGRLFMEFMYVLSSENGGCAMIAVMPFDDDSIVRNRFELERGMKLDELDSSFIGGRRVTPGMGICWMFIRLFDGDCGGDSDRKAKSGSGSFIVLAGQSGL